MFNIKRNTIKFIFVLNFLFIYTTLNCASATAFLNVTDAELQETCNSAIVGAKECFTTKILAWTPESDNLPNPCYKNGSNACWVFSGLRNVGLNGYVSRDESVNAINMKTIGDVRKAFIEKNPLPFSTTRVSLSVESNVCAAILYGPGSYDLYGYIILDGKAQLYPTSICAAPPPPIGSCKISGDILINYGTVSANKLAGLHASGEAVIKCDANTDVDFIAFSPSGSNIVSLRQDNSLSAKLTINGFAATEGARLNVPAGSAVNVTIDSELVTSGAVDAGPFSGTAVAEISLP